MKNVEINEKIVKIKECTYKIAYISTANCLDNQTWSQINAKTYHVYLMDPYANCLNIIFMNRNENLRNERKL